MQTLSPSLLSLIAFAPLLGALLAGLFGTEFLNRRLNNRAAHSITIALVAVSMVASLYVLYEVVVNNKSFNGDLYTWANLGGVNISVGFLVDTMTAMMMAIVTFVSLMVHIYSISYMKGDPGYQRFFAYISLFTFSMLMLVMANNMLQLFFGWEAVGLVSYLLIGFWYEKESAIFANFKAFMMNRVGDFGFILGIGLLFAYSGSLDYNDVFANPAGNLAGAVIPGTDWSVITVACICLFIGAMGKSAQVPLHSWLPDSMEGPTPISALIHAATMVTAGIFMVSRFSPVFELSDVALSFIMIIGAVGALFMGLLGLIQDDIKRVIAYSTLSQLGYMTVALGASAYNAALFHLMTHAFFKALLFLAAGSVIIAMHHRQDIRGMGGLRKYMPVTWITFLIGTLALVGTPFFAGFYSKDSIIEAAHASTLFGSGFAYWSLVIGVFVTSLYSFRLYFLVFHGKERHQEVAGDDHHEPKESAWTVTLPLILLAIPSVLIGAWAIEPMLFSGLFEDGIHINNEAHPAMTIMGEEFHGWLQFALHGLTGLPVLLTLAGFLVALYCYVINTKLPSVIYRRLSFITLILENKYFADWLNINVIAKGVHNLAQGLWRVGDKLLIDGLVVMGSSRLIYRFASISRVIQSGYIYHYAFAMLAGVILLISFFVLVL